MILAKLWRRAAETLIVDKALTMVDPTDDVDKINEPVFRYMSEKDIECYKSMITENHRQGEIKLSRELRQLLNIAYSPPRPTPNDSSKHVSASQSLRTSSVIWLSSTETSNPYKRMSPDRAS
jgi:hypothetical protein